MIVHLSGSGRICGVGAPSPIPCRRAPACGRSGSRHPLRRDRGFRPSRALPFSKTADPGISRSCSRGGVVAMGRFRSPCPGLASGAPTPYSVSRPRFRCTNTGSRVTASFPVGRCRIPASAAAPRPWSSAAAPLLRGGLPQGQQFQSEGRGHVGGGSARIDHWIRLHHVKSDNFSGASRQGQQPLHFPVA